MGDKISTLGIILGILIIIIGCGLGIVLIAEGDNMLFLGLAALIICVIYGCFVIRSSRRGTSKMQKIGIIISMAGFAILAVSAVMTYLVCFLELFGPIIDPPACVNAIFIFLGIYPAAIVFALGTIIFIVGSVQKCM